MRFGVHSKDWDIETEMVICGSVQVYVAVNFAGCSRLMIALELGIVTRTSVQDSHVGIVGLLKAARNSY